MAHPAFVAGQKMGHAPGFGLAAWRFLPGPQRRGTGGTLTMVWKGHRDRDGIRPKASAIR